MEFSYKKAKKVIVPQQDVMVVLDSCYKKLEWYSKSKS